MELLARLRVPGPERKSAFQEVVRCHQAWLVSFLTALLANPHDAQDVAQEVFLRAYLAMDRFRGDSRFRTWLTRIALNQGHNHRRRRRDLATGAELRPLQVAAPYPLIEREAVMKTLAALGHMHREVLVLRYFEELDVEEVAATLEIGTSAAKMRLQRARREFAERYEALTGEQGSDEATSNLG